MNAPMATIPAKDSKSTAGQNQRCFQDILRLGRITSLDPLGPLGSGPVYLRHGRESCAALANTSILQLRRGGKSGMSLADGMGKMHYAI
jgi:hypothetical protein